MTRPGRKPPRQKDLTDRLMAGDFDDERLPTQQRFNNQSRNAQQDRLERTALLRAAEADQAADLQTLPIGQIVQVFSLFYEVEHPTGNRLCVLRKTLSKLNDTALVVGDRVRFRDTETRDDSGRLEAVIEQLIPRQTVLFRGAGPHPQPIVANADQMLIVASLREPTVKWGLVDRMLIAAQSGGLRPIICLNKIDLGGENAETQAADQAMAHYTHMGIAALKVAADQKIGLDEVAALLKDKSTVLAGHSGVGKSTLIGALQPGLELRIGKVSRATDKGIHTTTSARRYVLSIGGQVIDTPGVKVFGLWGVTAENLDDYFPDITAGAAPVWRIESRRRIAASL